MSPCPHWPQGHTDPLVATGLSPLMALLLLSRPACHPGLSSAHQPLFLDSGLHPGVPFEVPPHPLWSCPPRSHFPIWDGEPTGKLTRSLCLFPKTS